MSAHGGARPPRDNRILECAHVSAAPMHHIETSHSRPAKVRPQNDRDAFGS